MILVIAGATGSGKSELAIALAKRIGGEVINADAFQLYQELSIATAKPSKEMRETVPHYLFDFVPLTEDYDVYQYQKALRTCIEEVLSRGKTPILAGGTGLYIRAGLFDYEFEEWPEVDMSDLDALDDQALFRELEKVDPEEAKKLHPNNRPRVRRALEIFRAKGITKTEYLSKQEHKPIYPVRFFGLKPERDELYAKVEKRVDKMFDEGLVEEDKRLIEKYGRSCRAFQAIGVKELFPYFDGEKSLEECKDEIKKNTRHYVKRQDTFFAHQFEIEWVDGLEDILKRLEQ